MRGFSNHVLASIVSVHKARQTQVNQFANVSRITLLAYDILLNIGREKRLVWEESFRISTVLYYILRYPVIAFQVFTLFLAPDLPHCDALYKFTFTLSITFTRVAICASFIMRVYAVLPKGIFCYLSTALLTAVGTLSVALDVVQVTEVSCTQSSSPIWLVLTFIVLICFDVMSTVLMSWGVFMIVRNQQGLTVNLKTLSKWRIPVVILKSGIMYYLIITGLQLGAVILYWLPQGVYSLVLNNYLTPLSTILVSRFLLDLREAMSQGSDRSSHTQEMQFAANSGADDSVTVRSFRIRSRGRMVTRKAGYQSGLYRDFQFEAGTQNQAGELD